MGKGTIKTKAMTMAVAMSMVAGLCPSTVFAANSEDVAKVQDGTYTGTAECTPDEYGDFEKYDLSVEVKIENGVIKSIGNIKGNGAEDNNTYITNAANGTKKNPKGVVQQIIDANGTDGINAVSRATCSSNAIVEAVNNALEEATKKEENKEENTVKTEDLQAVITKAEGLSEADYTAESWKTMQDALTAAKDALEKKESQTAVDSAKDTLNAEIDALVKKTPDVQKEVYVLMNIPYADFYKAEGVTGADAFNEEYAGTYHMQVEWIMETEEEYRKNLKRLNVTDELPAVIYDVRTLPSFYQMMVADGRIENLSPYLEEDEEWRNMIEPAVMEGCTDEDGNIYLGPISTAAFACAGMFWNPEFFAEAGIEKFPETWEEFWDCCDRLQANGITPLGLHTEGTGWAPMLIATAEAAHTEEGYAFMKELLPESYSNDTGLEIAETLQKLFRYTTEDAIHADYDVAYNNFVSGKVAMIPNGYWMIDQLPEEWKEKVRFSAFPGNKLIASPETFGWAVVSTYSEEVKEGAVEFLKFRTKFNLEEKKELMDKNGRTEISQLLQDYVNAYNNNPQIVPNYQVKWNSILQEETIGECLPQLAAGKMTLAQMVETADESIREYEKER